MNILPEKPPYGADCNRCGACCIAILCPLGTRLFRRTTGPCPALTFSPGRADCGLVLEPARFAPPIPLAVAGPGKLAEAAAILIGAGAGCDAAVAGEALDPDARQRIDRIAAARRLVAAEALGLWIGAIPKQG